MIYVAAGRPSGMFTLSLSDFDIELKDGVVKHVGTSTTAATAKLFHATAATARPFGDDGVRLCFDDGEGNRVEVTVDADRLESFAAEIDDLRDEGSVFE